jgi:coenzyme F420 hydrogenase subunit beta
MKSMVLSAVVNNDLCIGCGVCAAICPDNILEIQFNKYGEFNPVSIAECTKDCGLCLKVCPFANGNPDENILGQRLFGEVPGIQHQSEPGYFLSTFVGYSNVGGHREHGSSGGMATWLLETLLKDKIVDAVACITHNNDPEKLFNYAIFTSVDEVRASSGSAYYPVELSEVIRHIVDNPGKYAVIGLPCFVKSIRLAQQRNKILHERIVLVLGLTCGQLKSKYFTTYIGALAGLKEIPIRVNFREKDYQQPANNFYFIFNDQTENDCRIHWNEGISEAWVNRWFTPNACNYCDDIFAECADVTFMDAWLPEFSTDSHGTNLVIVRSQLANEIVLMGIKAGTINASEIEVSEVMRSQAKVIVVKRSHLAYRLHDAHLRKDKLPKKRVGMKNAWNPILRWDIELKEKMQQNSKRCFASSLKDDTFDIRVFRQSMTTYLDRIRLLRRLSNSVLFPVTVIRYIRRCIHG